MPKRDNSSSITRYRAFVRFNGQEMSLGTHDTWNQAKQAEDEFRISIGQSLDQKVRYSEGAKQAWEVKRLVGGDDPGGIKKGWRTRRAMSGL